MKKQEQKKKQTNGAKWSSFFLNVVVKRIIAL